MARAPICRLVGRRHPPTTFGRLQGEALDIRDVGRTPPHTIVDRAGPDARDSLVSERDRWFESCFLQRGVNGCRLWQPHASGSQPDLGLAGGRGIARQAPAWGAQPAAVFGDVATAPQPGDLLPTTRLERLGQSGLGQRVASPFAREDRDRRNPPRQELGRPALDPKHRSPPLDRDGG
jgi:hypothetical protein